jgi:hypothetical protein
MMATYGGYRPTAGKSLQIAAGRWPAGKKLGYKACNMLKISNSFDTGYNEKGCRPGLRPVKRLQKACKSAGLIYGWL